MTERQHVWVGPDTTSFECSCEVCLSRRGGWADTYGWSLGVDHAAGADHRGLARDDAARGLADLERLAAGDDGVPGVRPALVAADHIRALREQVDDLALALVAPLRADDDGRWHAPESA